MADTRCFVGEVRCGVTRLATWTPRKVEGEKSRVLLLDKAMKYGDLVKQRVSDQLLKFLDMSTARANRMRLKDLQDYLVWAAAHTHWHTHTRTDCAVVAVPCRQCRRWSVAVPVFEAWAREANA